MSQRLTLILLFLAFDASFRQWDYIEHLAVALRGPHQEQSAESGRHLRLRSLESELVIGGR